MKTLRKVLLLALLPLLFIACSDDGNQSVQKERVQFGFDVKSSGPSNGRTSTDLPDGAFLRVVLAKEGQPPVDTFKLNLLDLGTGVIADPIDLLPGRYSIQEFMIVSGNNVIFATPREGSTLAPAVAHDLPYTFTVAKNKISTVKMQVVSTTGVQPEAFGYISFSIDAFQVIPVTVFIEENGEYEFTSATAYIVSSGYVRDSVQLQARPDFVPFRYDPDDYYELVVKKEGYITYRQEFVYNVLINELNGKPWMIILKPFIPTLKMHVKVKDRLDLPRFLLGGTGHVNVHGLPGYDEAPLQLPLRSLTFPIGEYDVEFSGDLSGITAISFIGYTSAGITTMSGLEYLPNLKLYRNGGFYVDAIDLTHNPNLEEVYAHITREKPIYLPKSHHIREFYFSEPYSVTGMMVDSLTYNIYRNALQKSITNGNLNISGAQVLPPSPFTETQLQGLRALSWSTIVQN